MITHPEKLLFPEDGISKGELAAYYETIAPLMLPHLRGRPLTMERFPAGIGKKGFIQKDVSKGFPEWLKRIEVAKKDGTSWYPLVDDEQSLQWITHQNTITPHVWTSRVPSLHNPDLCIFDLDPAHDDPAVLRAVTLEVRDLLAELGLRSWLKTSGSKGFHIAVPLNGEAEFDAVSHFAHGVGAVLVKRNPSELTQEFIKADRGGRILVDTGRNRYGATFAAAYAVRPKPGAPVSAPCSWQELERGEVGPQTFTLRNLPERSRQVGDLWADIYEHGHSLSEAAEKLAPLLSAQEFTAALAAAGRKPGKRKKPE
ncbi:MAG TPA: non-homologous end-joining DNA ligase [Polyangiaceae bacterium]|nr:non-homologous end-joining DNA ligase [Polyangiaceae bacterium]